jgi:hypothetical protein
VVSEAKARTLLDATAAMTVEQCAAMEGRVLGRAGDRNNAQHASAVGYAARRVDPEGWAARREDKLRDVALVRTHHGDGVADVLVQHLDSYSADLLWTAAHRWARARKAAGDPRGLDALRAAAVVAWARDYLSGHRPAAAEPATTEPATTEPATTEPATTEPEATPPGRPGANGEPAMVHVLIPLPELYAPAGRGTGMIAGSGQPLPAEAVAALLRDGAGVRFALIDPAGNVAGVSTQAHDPTMLMRVYLTIRDVTVRVPGGSTRPVAGEDWDHLDETGPTEAANLHPP